MNNFKEEVLQSEIPVIVDFYADWCPPCKIMNSVLQEISNESNSKHKIVKVNIDSFEEITEKYRVNSVPTFVIFKNGKEAQRLIGICTKEEILKCLLQ